MSPAVPDMRIIGAIKTKNRMFTRNNSNKNSKSLSGSGRRSALPKSMATVGTLGVMLAIPTLLNFKAPLNSYRPKSSTPNISSLYRTRRSNTCTCIISAELS